ncbi:MAG TPA: glycosyltransferase family 9 protein [Opitutaceae bacterium]|nr:glycosyltransferase family 9 protein [Opitutaceae bacterium]
MNQPHRLPLWLRRLLARHLAHPAALASTPRRRRACLYKVDRIGDFILATGALRMLVDHFGAAECRLIVSSQAAPFAAAEFPDVERWTAPAGTSGVWREMRPLRRELAPQWAEEEFATLICLRHQHALHHDLTLSWIRAENWRGLGERPTVAHLALDNRPEPATGYPATTEAPWCRELLAHRQVLSAVLGRDVSWEEMSPRLRYLQPEAGCEIVLCPFGGACIRDYPRAAWLAAWRQAVEPHAVVRLLGSGERRDELEQFAADLRAAEADVVVTADAPPRDFARHVAQARMVLTVESAAAHIAVALDKPAAIVMGGGHFGWFAPWGDSSRQRWLHHPLDCYGCNWQCRRPRIECLLDLPATAVAQSIREVLPHA